MLKILYVANVRLVTTKAHSWQILKTCEALSANGAEVVLIVPESRISNREQDPFEHYGINRSFTIEYLPTPLLLSFGRVGFWVRSLIFLVRSWWQVMTSPGDVVVYSRDELPILLTSLCGKEAIWEVHVSRFNWIINLAAKLSLGMVMISFGLRDFFVKHGIPEEKFVIAPDGVDMEQFDRVTQSKFELRKELSLPEDKKILCYTGRYRTMGMSKGVDSLFEWLSLVLKSEPSAFLLVVGLSKEEIVEVNELAKGQNLPRDCYGLFGYVSHDQVIKFLKASDVLIMNYPNNPHYAHFMSPLKLFEYMASGVPIVSSDLPSLREVISDESAFFFAPDDKKSFVGGVDKALASKEEGEKRASNAYELAKTFSWSNRAKGILNFVQERLQLD